MQTQGGVDADAAILSPDKTIRAEIKVDWFKNGGYAHFLTDLSPYADNITVDRSLAGAAPSEVMLIEGAAAAELTFEVGGSLTPGVYGALTLTDPMDFVSVLSPYNGASPMYNVDMVGSEITYRIGVDTAVGTIWYPQFIGNIRTVTPTRGTNKVTITALDRVEKLRKPITHTDWGVLDLQANQGRIQGQLMNAHWVIDHCLKSCDASASPYRWAYDEEIQFAPPSFFNQAITQVYLSGNGGIAPNVGWVDGSNQNQFPATDTTPALTMYQDRGQAHGSSPEPTNRPQMFRAQRDWGDDFNIFWAADKNRVLEAKSHQITFTLHTETFAGSEWFSTMADAVILAIDTKDNRQLQVWVGGGSVFLRYVDNSIAASWVTTRITIPTGVGNEYARITANLQYGNGSGTLGERMQLRVNATSTAYVNMQNLGAWVQTEIIGRFLVWREVSIQDVAYVTYDYYSTPTHSTTPAKYVGVLDHSLNRLSFLPKRWGSLAWDVITEVAAAEFGAVFWDESGYFHFWNQDTILAKKDTFVRSFTLDDVSGLEITSSTDSIRNIYSVTVKKARVQTTRVFETKGPDELYLPPSQWTEYQVWVDNIVTPNSGQPPTYYPDNTSTLPVWDDSVNFGVLAQRLIAGVWTQFVPASPWIGFMYRLSDGSTFARLWNGFSDPVRFADPNSGPAFRWNGSFLTEFDDQVFTLKDQTSVTRWGPQGLPLQSDWYQEFFDYGSFFSKMLARTTKSIPTTQNIEVTGDPRIQLGDAVKILDPKGLGESMQLQVLGINRTLSKDNGLIDSYTVELTESPRVGIWDSAQYGIWDASFIWT
jgi:hypothetical protein